MEKYYVIKLDNPMKISEYSIDKIKDDMIHMGIKSPLELKSQDVKIFETKLKAENYIRKYKRVLNEMGRRRFVSDRSLPKLSLQRRILVQSLMREKLKVSRTYLKKDWKKGTIFQGYDQTNFVTLRIRSIKKVCKGYYCYKFELAE